MLHLLLQPLLCSLVLSLGQFHSHQLFERKHIFRRQGQRLFKALAGFRILPLLSQHQPLQERRLRVGRIEPAQILKNLERLIEFAAGAIGIGQEKLRPGQVRTLANEARERVDCGSGVAAPEVHLGQEHHRLGKVGLEGERLVQTFQRARQVVVQQAGDGQPIVQLRQARIDFERMLQFVNGLGRLALSQPQLRELQQGIQIHGVTHQDRLEDSLAVGEAPFGQG